MGSINDKLSYLSQTKGLIKNAIIEKGQSVADTDTFRSYADKIDQISGEGTDFVGSFQGYWGGPYYDVNEKILRCDTSNTTAIIAKIVPWSQLTSWEIGIVISNYKNSHYSTSRYPFLAGTASYRQYFQNPAIELLPIIDEYRYKNSLGCHYTTTMSSWTTVRFVELSEEIDPSKKYKITCGWDGQKLYAIVKNLDSGVIVAYDEIEAQTNPHTIVSSQPFGFLGFGREGIYNFKGNLHLAGCYLKENGVITWGCDSIQ